jgi:hypothetical protein
MSELTAFERECHARGWGKTNAFLAAFAQTALLVGEEVSLTDRQVRRWKLPQPPRPRPRAWRVLHAMFGRSPLELGFPGPTPADDANGDTLHGSPGGGQRVGVERRTFLADTFGTAAGLTVGTADAVGTVHLAELREGLHSLYTLDDAYGGGDVRSLAVRHLRRVRRVINTSSYPDSIGRQLHLLAGETAEQCAWLYYDADQQDEARRYWGEALTTATMLRDDSLEVLVLASLSMQAIHEDRPRDGYDLARAARQRAEPMGSPVLLSLITAREARALARMRDHTAARRELTKAMRMGEQHRGGPTPEWAAFHGQAELDFAQGLLFTEAGHHNAAVPFLRAALRHQDRTYGRNRALYRLTLARSLVQAGEVDEAGAEAVSALEHLAEVESGRVNSRLVEVRDLLAACGSSTAREPAEALSDYVGGSRA